MINLIKIENCWCGILLDVVVEVYFDSNYEEICFFIIDFNLCYLKVWKKEFCVCFLSDIVFLLG